MVATHNRAKNRVVSGLLYKSQTTQMQARTCYGPRLVRTHPRSGAARLAVAFTGVLLVAAVPVAVGADSSELRDRASGLRAHTGSLEARAQAATLELYSLEAQLGRARAELAALDAERQQLAREQTSARAKLVVVRRAVRVSQTRLADLVRMLYQQPGQDPLAILLGAGSLEEAFAGLDNLDRAAVQTKRILEQAREARAELTRSNAVLAARAARLAAAVEAVAGRAASIEATAAARRDFVAGLRRQQGLNTARVAAIEAQARAAERRTAGLAVAAPAPEVSPVEAAPATPAPVAADGPRTLTVSTTGYALQGRTATGIQTAPGVVAVDPSVIPLGTRMTVPGYGVGIAADTGGAVHGAEIDLWFPTTAQALAWGRRTVTITIH
jgi:3D (Asp-Asp-Asp) domain-containing protein